MNMLLYFCVVLALFASITLLTREKAVYIDNAESLTEFDFSSDIAYISEKCFDWYPRALYTPDDFASGRVTEEPAADDGKSGYYTYRFILELEEGRVYGISGNSATYAQQLWIDGVLCSRVGTPGDSLETMTPQMNFFTVYFESKGVTEIVIQRSGFVHANGGRIFPLYLGEQSLISSMSVGIWVRGAVIVGCMLMSALVFFGIFLFSNERRHFLWFSLSCLVITIRSLSTEHKLIMTLIPDLNWYMALKCEYLATISFHFLLFLYVNRMFDQEIKRPVNITGLVFVSFYFFLILFSPSTVYTAFLPYMQLCALLYVFATISILTRCMVKDREKRLPEHFLILFGTIGYTLLLMIEIILHYFDVVYRDLNLAQLGMTVFVLANMLALALNFTRTEAELSEARRSKREMEEINQLLESLSRIKSDFLNNISHEMKTPLTIMGSYAGVALQQIRKNAVDDRTVENLDIIQREALRLGNMVEQLKTVSLEKEQQLALTDTDTAALLQRAADFCAPICQKNGNTIFIYAESKQISLRTNADAVFQVLFNLITNANRHTKEGTIALAAWLNTDEPDDGTITFSVSDDGDGVPPELLPSVFERGVSGDGGTGLGLAICREIVEEYGGEVEITSSGYGTTVSFTLPCQKEENLCTEQPF